jgi:tetratricopeptide (TPR) repeat protein
VALVGAKPELEATLRNQLVVLQTQDQRDQLRSLLSNKIIDQVVHIDDTYVEMQKLMRKVVHFVLEGWNEQSKSEAILNNFHRNGIAASDLLLALEERFNSALDDSERAAVEHHRGLFFEVRLDGDLARDYYNKAANLEPSFEFSMAAGIMSIKVGLPDQAEEIFARALEHTAGQLEEVKRLRLINGYASSLFHQEMYLDAFAAYNPILLNDRWRTLPTEISAIFLNNLGWTLVKLGDLDRGTAFLRESLKAKKVSGDTAASSSLTMCNLASAHIKQDELEKARFILKDAERLLKVAYQSSYPCHPALARVYNQLGNLEYNQYNYDAAAELFAKSVVILDDQFSDCNQQKLISLHNHALAALHSGKPVIGSRLQVRVRSILENCPDIPISLAEAIHEDYASL